MQPMYVLSRYLSGWLKETMKILSHDSQCPDRELNRALPEYKSKALQPVPTYSVPSGRINE
jgi:hypothetical protein